MAANVERSAMVVNSSDPNMRVPKAGDDWSSAIIAWDTSEGLHLKSDDNGAAASMTASRETKRQVRWWTNFENEPHNEDAMLSLIKKHPKSITGIYTYIGAGQGNSGSLDFGHNAATNRNMTWIREKVKLYHDLGITVTPSLSFTNESIMSGNALQKVSEVATFAKAAGVDGLMLGALKLVVYLWNLR